MSIFWNKTRLKKNKASKLDSYYHFIKVMVPTSILCFSVNPVRDIFVILSNYRLPLTEDGMFYAYQIKERYASHITKPKTVIVAGSSALLGISAEQIEVSTSNPTVNFGTHAGFGIDYILHKAKSVLKPGDTVLLPIEFELYHQTQDKQLLSAVLKRHIISYDRNYIFDLDCISQLKFFLYPSGLDENKKIIKAFLLNDLLSLLDKNYIYQRALAAAKKGTCYTGMTLNRNGDEICNVGKSPVENIETGRIGLNIQPIDPSGSIKNFLTFAKKHRITIVPLYPAVLQLPEYKSDKYKKYFLKIKTFWIEQGLPFEDSVDLMLLEKKMMFDTYYHPNDRGRKFRTQHVINILNNSSDKSSG